MMELGSIVNVVVRELALHQYGLDSIPALILCMV